MPSVGGRKQHLVAALLVATGTATGAVVGLASAIVLWPLGRFSGPAVLLLVALGLILDGLHLARRGPGPPASGRQVPREWSRLFDARLVAMLYGARLGVGPLTILSTWTWWSVTVAAALVGPVTATLVGATFGLVRLIVTVAVSALSAMIPAGDGPTGHSVLFGRLRARQRSNWIAINGVGFAALLAVALIGCGGDSREHADQAGGDEAAARWGVSPEDSGHQPAIVAGADGSTGGGASALESDRRTFDLQTIVTIELEDVVRTDLPNTGGAGTTVIPDGLPAAGSTAPAGGIPSIDAAAALARTPAPAPAVKPSNDPAALAKVLLGSIDGFQPVNDPDADRGLDLAAASQIQPDPTEELALLETRGFEGGWTRAFLNDANDVAVASVYQFEDAAEAEFYLEDGLITIGGYGGKFFDIEDQPGVRGFIQYFTETDQAGTEDLVSLGAAFQLGPRWYLVYFVGSTESVTPAVLFPAIAAQRQLALR